MKLILVDYATKYFTEALKTGVPARRQGKFIQVRRYSADTEYIVLSVREITAYHANIAERFFGEQRVEGGYNRKGDRFEISSSDWEIVGGGVWEMDEETKRLRLSGDSKAYGAFDPVGLAQRLGGVAATSGYDIKVD